MSKMKELDNIADVVVDILEEHLEYMGKIKGVP